MKLSNLAIIAIILVFSWGCDGNRSSPTNNTDNQSTPSNVNFLGSEVVDRGEEIKECEKQGVSVPEKLPDDPETCSSEMGKTNGRTSNGWRCTGVIPTGQLLISKKSSSSLWLYENQNTICYYLPRPYAGSTTEGSPAFICMSSKTCATCEFDARGEWPKRPEDMTGPFNTTACSNCHHEGFIFAADSALKAQSEISEKLLLLRNNCNKLGGPLWINQTNQPDNRKPVKADLCASPDACSSCHESFRAKQSKDYCQIAKQSLTSKPDHAGFKGSMVKYFVNKIDVEQCYQLSECTGCNLPCDVDGVKTPKNLPTSTMSPDLNNSDASFYDESSSTSISPAADSITPYPEPSVSPTRPSLSPAGDFTAPYVWPSVSPTPAGGVPMTPHS